MSIELRKGYSEMLDEVYALESVTGDLGADKKLIKAGSTAKSVLYPVVDVDGLGDYSRKSGYTDGEVTAEYKEIVFDYDRGRRFNIDEMDDQESFDALLGSVSGEFVRTKVAPEGDALCFAEMAKAEGVTLVSETLADGEAVLASITDGSAQMDEDEVPAEGRILYITPALLKAVKKLDTTKSREILEEFEKVVKVPQRRFYTAIELLDGQSEGEEAGGYKMAADGKEINFTIVHKSAVVKIDKHVVKDIILPENNPNADATIVKYRKYGTVKVQKNKSAGIYISHKE